MRLGLGGAELLVIIGLVLLLFGPSILAFWLGYITGKGRAKGSATQLPLADSRPAVSPPKPPSEAASAPVAPRPQAPPPAPVPEPEPTVPAAEPEQMLPVAPEAPADSQPRPAAENLWIESVLSTEYIEPEPAAPPIESTPEDASNE